MCEAKKQFNTIKADLKWTQREYYHNSSRNLAIPEGKEVYVRRPPLSSQPKGSASRFVRRFDGPYVDLRHIHGRPDLLALQHKFAKDELKTVNMRKSLSFLSFPDGQFESSTDLRDSDKKSRDIETVPTSNPPTRASAAIDPDMTKLAFSFRKYLVDLPTVNAYSSEACKFIYQLGSRGTRNSETLRKIVRSCLEVSLSDVVWRRTWRNLCTSRRQRHVCIFSF